MRKYVTLSFCILFDKILYYYCARHTGTGVAVWSAIYGHIRPLGRREPVPLALMPNEENDNRHILSHFVISHHTMPYLIVCYHIFPILIIIWRFIISWGPQWCQMTQNIQDFIIRCHIFSYLYLNLSYLGRLSVVSSGKQSVRLWISKSYQATSQYVLNMDLT